MGACFIVKSKLTGFGFFYASEGKSAGTGELVKSFWLLLAMKSMLKREAHRAKTASS